MSLLALAVATVALVLSVLALVATGTMALKLRLVQRRSTPPRDDAVSEPLPTLGRRALDVLNPVVRRTISTVDGDAEVYDTFLVDDGVLLGVSTNCSSCRHLLEQSADLLIERNVRTMVAAQSIERGIEFVEVDSRASGIPYQIDVGGEAFAALGVRNTPVLIRIANGVLEDAHIVLKKEHIAQFSGERSPYVSPQ